MIHVSARRHSISAPVLRVRCEQRGESVHSARHRRRVGHLPLQKQSHPSDAAPAKRTHASRPKVPADVSR
jgi:hypothetical protein